MMIRMNPCALLGAAALLAAANTASAQVATLDVDSAQSSLRVDVSAVGFSDNDTTNLTGSVQLELDDYGMPTGVSLVDFALDATSPLTFTFNASFLGSATLSISGIGADYGTTIPTAFAPVDAGGNFSIIGVPIALTGSGTAVANGIFSSLNGASVNLADFGTFSGDLAGTVQVVGDQVVLNVNLSGEGDQVVSGVTISAAAEFVLVASGDVPAVVCVGDIADDFGFPAPDGQVSFGDFLQLLTLLGPCPGGTPGCTGDIADDFGFASPDGQVSFGDFLLLLTLLGPCP